MKDKQNCNIVKDLLPNYIEKLTSEESNQYIKEHLNSCVECKAVYIKMEKNLEGDIVQKSDKKEFDFLKKYRKRLNIFKLISLVALIVLVIFATNIGKKMTIISDLSNKSKQYELSTNYRRIDYKYGEETITKIETFRLGDKIKKVFTTLTNESEVQKVIIFGNMKVEGDEINKRYLSNMYMENKSGKVAYINQESSDLMLSSTPQNILHTEDLWDLFRNSMFTSIKMAMFNDSEYYYITNFDSKGYMYINKETGLPISIGEYEDEDAEGIIKTVQAMDAIYEFGIVSEDDLIEPNIAEYEVVNSNSPIVGPANIN